MFEISSWISLAHLLKTNMDLQQKAFREDTSKIVFFYEVNVSRFYGLNNGNIFVGFMIFIYVKMKNLVPGLRNIFSQI